MTNLVGAVFSYAKDSLFAVVPAVTEIAHAIVSTLYAKAKSGVEESSQKQSVRLIDREINNHQSFVGTRKKVADVFHPLRQSKKAASSGPSDRSIMTRLWFRMSYKPAG